MLGVIGCLTLVGSVWNAYAGEALQSRSVDPRLSFGVANAVEFSVRYENPVSKTYPVSVYQGTVKMYSCSAKITLKVSATSDSKKSINQLY